MTCNSFLPLDCDTCANGAYKIFGNECSNKCPLHYVEDDENRVCSFDTDALNTPEIPKDPYGCMHGTYWSWPDKKCMPCYH